MSDERTQELTELHGACNILNEVGFNLSTTEYENELNEQGYTLVYDSDTRQSTPVRLGDVR